KGFKIVGAKLMQVSDELAKTHYDEHSERPLFGELVEFINSGPVFAMVLEGENVIKTARLVVGSTNTQEASHGINRADFGLTVGKNINHSSDSPESAEREINLFFDQSELVDYNLSNSAWIY